MVEHRPVMPMDMAQSPTLKSKTNRADKKKYFINIKQSKKGKMRNGDERKDSEVKSTYSQHPYGSSRQSITPVLRDLIPSSGLCKDKTHVCSQTYTLHK